MLATFPEEERQKAIETWPITPFTPSTTLDRAQIASSIKESARDGYAISTGQMILNEIGVASPIIGHDGRAFAAVQCSVSAHTWTRERIVADILPKLQDTANAISPAFHANHAGWD